MEFLTAAFPHLDPNAPIQPLGEGLIHKTYLGKLKNGKSVVLQNINDNLFSPDVLTKNHEIIYAHLSASDFPFLLPKLLPCKAELPFFRSEKEGTWRMMTYLASENPIFEYPQYTNKNHQKTYETAYAFGLFDAFLSQIPSEEIIESIPNFHHTPSRWEQFEAALKMDVFKRKKQCGAEIEQLLQWKPRMENIFLLFEKYVLPQHLIHNDAKANNVLLSSSGSPIAVVDWDTIMVGCPLVDIGDLIRTLTPNFDENHTDLESLKVDFEAVNVVIEGFIQGYSEHLPKEKQHLAEIIKNYRHEAAPWIIGEQTLRFLTDYLNGETYYKTEYIGQNLWRAKNQLKLLQEYILYVNDD